MKRGNPFSTQAAEAARQRVERLQERHPALTKAELAGLLINDKAKLCAFAGAFTAIPALMPGLGTVVAIFSGLLIDITVLGYLLSRLVLELSTLYGHDPLSGRVQQEALRVFALAAGVQSAGKRAAKTLAHSLTRQASSVGMNRPLVLMGLRASQRSILVRVLPLAGIGLAAVISYLFARGIGRRMLAQYDIAETQIWQGRTLDADYRVNHDEGRHGRGTVI